MAGARTGIISAPPAPAHPVPLFDLSHVRWASLRLACSRKVYAFKTVGPCYLILTLGGTSSHPFFFLKKKGETEARGLMSGRSGAQLLTSVFQFGLFRSEGSPRTENAVCSHLAQQRMWYRYLRSAGEHPEAEPAGPGGFLRVKPWNVAWPGLNFHLSEPNFHSHSTLLFI